MSLSFAFDEFKLIYLTVTVASWLLMALFAPRYMKKSKNKKIFAIFSILTLIGTAGVFVSGDLLTLFAFFELMSLASYVWVAWEETKEALKAAETYLAVAVIGGLVLLMGLFLLRTAVGTLNLNELKQACLSCKNTKMLHAAAFCMLFGFGAKAGAFPLHIWLPKAHPVAPAPASALLSGVLTKTGVYGIILTAIFVAKENFFGKSLMVIAVLTMVTGAVLALFSTDLKRTLACSSVSQIGFILTGVASATIVADSGTALAGSLMHMINHTTLKLVLFFSAGAIYQNTHRLDLEGLRGYGRRKPFLFIAFLLGTLGLGGVPGFNGFVSKTLLHEAINECAAAFPVFIKICEITFVISGGFTVAYMLKLFVCIFLEKNRDEKLQNQYDSLSKTISKLQYVAIGIPTVLIFALGGAFFGFTSGILQSGVGSFSYAFDMPGIFEGECILAAAESISIGLILYFAVIRADERKNGYKDRWPKFLDIEEQIYRPALLKWIPGALSVVFDRLDKVTDSFGNLLSRTVFKELPREKKKKPLSRKQLEKMRDRGIVSRTLSYGLMLCCIGMFFLLAYLLFLVFIQ